ncbi:MAG TPA: NADH-quinone oxidoreductase subunit D [Thermoanaerobaculia bacterium]|jgi:NADH-quinone oxidoreductase subunit D|nr:NADH-quinone oxidoreductase subunit D [Thermoanaerobaculia bacterium]
MSAPNGSPEPGSDRRVDPLFEGEEMELSFGPQHPATHGVLRLNLKIEGERIVGCYPIIGYLHRGTEKLFELHPFFQNVPHTDRMDYVAAATNNLAYVGAVEKLVGLTVPPRARYLRTILAELQRISSHLVWLATHAIDIGAMTPFFYCFRERERVLDLFEHYCGARLTLNCMRPGGLPFDLPAGWTDACRRFYEDFPAKIDEYEGLLTDNRIWKRRTVGVGVLSPEAALDLGVTGPMLRASGVGFDLRKVRPYEAYGEVEFAVPVTKNGDTYDRYLVRIAEMRESTKIVRQCLELLPATDGGPIMAKRPRVLKGPKAEVYHGIEGPKGEIGFYIVGDGTPNPYRCHVRPPSFMNLQALPDLAKGHLVADLVALIGSTDIVLGEVDR